MIEEIVSFTHVLSSIIKDPFGHNWNLYVDFPDRVFDSYFMCENCKSQTYIITIYSSYEYIESLYVGLVNEIIGPNRYTLCNDIIIYNILE